MKTLYQQLHERNVRIVKMLFDLQETLDNLERIIKTIKR